MNRSLLGLTLFVSLAALVLGVFLGARGIYTKPAISADTREALVKLNRETRNFYYYNTVDFTTFDPPPRHEACGYSNADLALIEKNNIQVPCVLWNNLLDAKERFRILSLEARALAPDTVLAAMNNVETGFDEVWNKAISEEYYLKWPADSYNEVMQPKIDNLESAIREALK